MRSHLEISFFLRSPTWFQVAPLLSQFIIWIQLSQEPRSVRWNQALPKPPRSSKPVDSRCICHQIWYGSSNAPYASFKMKVRLLHRGLWQPPSPLISPSAPNVLITLFCHAYSALTMINLQATCFSPMFISGLTTLSDLLRHLRESIYFYLIRWLNKRFVKTLLHKHSFEERCLTHLIRFCTI